MTLDERLRQLFRHAEARATPEIGPDVIRGIGDRPRRGITLPLGWGLPLAAAVVLVVVFLIPPGRGGPAGGGPAGGGVKPQAGSEVAGASTAASAPDRPSPAVSSPPPNGSDSGGQSVAPSASSAGSPIATSAPGFSGGDALGGGTLGVERSRGAICFFVTSAGRSAKTALVWPFGFSAGGNPISVLGPDGQALGHEGDVVALGGGAPPPGFVPSRGQDPCALGSIFWVSSVVSVNGQARNVGEGSLRLVLRPPDDAGTCPRTVLEPLMLVMVDQHLQLRVVSSGVDLEATWPAGYVTRTDPIRVVAPDGKIVAIQGRESDGLRGRTGPTGVTICG